MRTALTVQAGYPMKIVVAYARAALITIGLFTSLSAVEAQTTYTATASMAALKAYGSSSSTVAHAHVVAYYSNGTTGGGDFDWGATCPGTANGGTWIAATGVTAGCWVREVSGGLTPEMFGAKGTIPALTNCTIASGAAVVTCSGHTFRSGNVGDLASFYLAGATHSGGRNWTLNSTIVSVSGSTATLAAHASNTVSSAGVFAFGPDDTVAMNAALASNGPTTAFVLSAPAYMITSTFNIGNNSRTWTHNIATVGNPTIICAIANHTDDCVDRQSYNNGSGYLPSFITGGITFDNMNNGLEGFNDKGGYNVYQQNVSIKRSYRDCWARTVSDSSFIQQYTAVNTSLFACGLHGILNWTSDKQIYNGFIDEIMHIGLDIEGWGYNSGQFGVTGNQMGAAIYSVNTGSAAQNFILGHTFLGAVEINSNRAQAVAYGTDQNPNAIFFADGQQPNTVFGGCITAPCSNAVGYSFKRWYFESPTIECSAGCSTPATGATFAFQTTRLTPNAMRFQDLVISGAWTAITSNISFGTDCSTSGNGCGNSLSQANYGTPSQSLGYTLAAPTIAASGAITAGGAVTGSDLAYNQTIRSSVAPITVPFATPTDITSNFGHVHNWVEVSGECSGTNFDDWVPWQYFGTTPITQALKGDVYGTAPSRTYTINPSTGYVSLTTGLVNSSCSVHVSPFGGH
jgi:hypothetical protein